MAKEYAADVLLVETDAETARAVVSFLTRRKYRVEWVNEGEKAFNRLDSQPFDVLVAELSVRRVDGMRLMQVAKQRNPEICVIFLGERPDVERATEVMRQGAYDFQTKPLNLGKLEAVIQRGLEHQRLVLEQLELKRRLDAEFGLARLLGRSRQMAHVYSLVRQAAGAQCPVLIQGEPGAGKDLIAQAIHNSSSRRDHAFVKMNCGGVSDAQVHSELFGHTRGAFPGAETDQAGRLEIADKGTLFLDDIGQLPLGLQAKLLRVLEEQRFERFGEGRARRADVRVIAATDRPLAGDVETGRFYGELFRKLAAVVIEVPPLRDRREDIPLLSEHFLRESCQNVGKPLEGISANAMDLLTRYDWPGNVRELRNIIEGMVLMARPGSLLDVTRVPQHLRRAVTPGSDELRIPIGASMTEIERLVIEETLKACGHDKRQCAHTLGIGLRTLYRKIHDYGLR